MVQAMKNVQIIIVKVIMGFRSPQKDPTIGGDVCQESSRMWLLSLVKHPPLVLRQGLPGLPEGLLGRAGGTVLCVPTTPRGTSALQAKGKTEAQATHKPVGGIAEILCPSHLLSGVFSLYLRLIHN